MIPFSRHHLLPALAALALVQPAAAQDKPKIQAYLSASQAAVGDQVIYAVQIEGGQSPQIHPPNIDVEGLNVQFAGANNRRVLRTPGQFSSVFEYRYYVSADAAGEFTIPAQSLIVDGQTLTSEAVTLKISEAPPLPENVQPIVQLRAAKTELWKGELAPVSVTIYASDQIDIVSPPATGIPSEGIVVERFDRPAMTNIEPLNGQIFRTFRMQSIFTTVKTGNLTLGPAEVKVDVLVPQGGFRDTFGSLPQMRRTIKIKSNPVAITVKDLPSEGRPDAKGEIAVGRFNIRVMPDRTNAALGEPLALDIQVSGQGNFDLLSAPQIEKPDGWRLYNPRITQEARGWGTEGAVRAWAQVIVPEKNLTELPSFVVNTFDPELGQYVTLRSDPVPLTITGSAAAFAQQNQTLSGTKDFGAPIDAAKPQAELGDILADPLTNAALVGTVARPVVSQFTLHVCGAALLGIILLGGLTQRIRQAAALRAERAKLPREPADVLHDMRRSGISKEHLYGLATEFANSWTFHRKSPLPAEGEKAAALSRVFAQRDRCLYAPDAVRQQPAAPDEQKAVTSVLASL